VIKVLVQISISSSGDRSTPIYSIWEPLFIDKLVSRGGNWKRGHGGTVNPPRGSKERDWKPSAYRARASSILTPQGARATESGSLDKPQQIPRT
jgi:hypothetical protein